MNLDLLTTDALEGKRSFQKLVEHNLDDARKQHGPIKSMHEGLAILLEEFEEFKQEVFKKNVDKNAILKEVAQLAAMCQRFAEDVLKTKGEK